MRSFGVGAQAGIDEIFPGQHSQVMKAFFPGISLGIEDYDAGYAGAFQGEIAVRAPLPVKVLWQAGNQESQGDAKRRG